MPDIIRQTGLSKASVYTCSWMTKARRPVIEIDHYGERLIGCIECNRCRSREEPTHFRYIHPL